MWLQIVLIILSGLASGLNNALFTSYVMDISPYERSITSGVYNFVRWLGGAIAPILSGIIALVGCVMICIPVQANEKVESKTLS